MEATAVDDRSETLAGTFELAATTLAKHDIEVSAEVEKGEEAEHLRALFGHATKVLDAGGKTLTKEGGFFLADGSRVEGKVVEIGRIASYGVASGNAGALAPADLDQHRLRLLGSDQSRAPHAATAAGHAGLASLGRTADCQWTKIVGFAAGKLSRPVLAGLRR